MQSYRLGPLSLLVSACAVALTTAAANSTTTSAQTPSPSLFFVPGRNVNTVGPTPPGPNPDLVGNPLQKQRNEASCDVSPDNALVVLCANNDYRGIERFGDSWIGLTQSRDGGLTWRSRLLSGFPSAPSGIGAADPVVRTVPGLGLVAYITLSRTDDRGSLSLALLAARNKENGDPYEFLERRVIGTGTPGRFNDKPAMAVELSNAGGTIDVAGRTIPRATIHYAYAVFPGNENNSSSQIYHLLSEDYGRTWTSPRKLSESLGMNQGVDISVAGTTVVAAWRQVADTNQQDGIVFARSGDGGQTWSKPAVLWSGPGRFFDQDTSPVQFRTLSMPSVLHDGNAFHAFWSARGFAAHPDDARIVVSSSRDGRNWSAPSVVENFAGRGHQIVPQAAVAGGRIQVNWIDTRNNEPGTFDRFITDFRADAAGNRVPLSAPADASAPPTTLYRQMADIFAAQAPAAAPNGQPSLAFVPPAQVSRYRFGLVDGTRRQLEYSFINARMFKNGNVPFHGDYHAVAGQRYRPSETTAGAYVRNTAPSTNHAVFYSAFTDNREAQGYLWAGPPSTSFTPAETQLGESGQDQPVACTPSETTADTTVWAPGDSTRSRYQNIYAAATLPGLLVASPSASKPTGTLERAFVIFVHNLTSQDRTYRFSIANQPGDAPPAGTGRASFRQDDPNVPASACADGAPCAALDVTISRASSVTRTVYVRSTVKRPRIVVRVQEQGGDGQTGSVILNANPAVAEIESPDGGLPDIMAYEVYEPDILTRQTTLYSSGLANVDVTPVEGTIQNPRIEYPRIEYPRIEYPRIEYPRIEYPRIEYDPLGNPRIEYPRIEYPRIEYKSVENPRIEYSAITSGDPVAITEVTWPVTTDGANTTTAITAKMFVNGSLTGITSAQLLVSIPHFTTVTRTCDGQPITSVENQVVVSTVVDPASLARTPGGPDTVNPPVTQPTFFVSPNQVAYVTLRIVGRSDPLLASRVGIIVRSQADTSDGDVSTEDEDSDAGLDVVPDTTAPHINLGELAGGITAEGNRAGGADVGFVVSATDEGGSATVSCLRRLGDGDAILAPSDGTTAFYSIGSWQVTCTAVDEAGNQASAGFPVAVVDTKPPTLDVSGLQISLTFTTGGAVVSYTSSGAAASDAVDTTPTVVCEPPAGTVFPLGPAQITCTATDDFGNSTVATRSFTVTDTVAPVLSVSPVTAEATSAAGAVVTLPVTATDSVDATPTISCTPASGSTFPIGVTLVSCVAVDDSGNASAAATFTVTVRDTRAPSSIVATVTPSTIWPPSGTLVPVTVAGQAFDEGSGIAAIEWRVVDEYKQHEPSGSFAMTGNGSFSFSVPLLSARRGNDKDGRHYTIILTAVDRAGNRVQLSQPLVVNIHDQGS